MNRQAKNTTVVLLAAGHGKRMLPLTEKTPKPLLKVGEYALIEHHLVRLAELGFKNVVINVAYLAAAIKSSLGDGERFGLKIQYSDESDTGALETAGGLQRAMPLIQSDPFISVNADVWTDFDFSQLLQAKEPTLVMVDNPPQHPNGDFGICANGLLTLDEETKHFTYSGIALYPKSLFSKMKPGKHALAPVFRALIADQGLYGIKLAGEWRDIGTPERLEELRANLVVD